MKNKTLILVILFLITSITSANAETFSIAGLVKDKSSGEPLIGASVMLESNKLGAKSNKNGFYSIQNVPKGDYNVIARYMGYKEYKAKVKVTGDDVRLNIDLESQVIATEGVTVTANKEVETREISISKVNVPINTIKNIQIGGESDVFRTLQFLPGVLTSSQISSGLYVRGGSPDQNLVQLDGATVYNPSHLFGFFSTFNTSAVKDVEFIKGGFNAEYGGRLSSVLNITQKDGNTKEFQGEANIGLISSQIGIEVPLFNGSLFVSGRRTYLDLLEPVLKQFTDGELPDFYFYDINAKLTQNFGDDDKVSITAFGGNDILHYGPLGSEINMEVGNRLLSGHWTHIFNNNLFSNLVINYSKYRNYFSGGQTGYAFLMDNSIEDITGKLNFEWLLGENASVIFGGEVNKLNFDFLVNFTGDTVATSAAESGQVNLKIPDVNYAAFIQSKFNLTEYLSIQAGLRASYYQLNGISYIDPRLALRYMLTGNTAVKLAWGTYHQGLRIAGFPNFSIVDIWLPSDTSVRVSNSHHYILSVENTLPNEMNLNFDVYYKTLTGIGELNQMTLTAEKVKDVLFIGNGYSYGAEVFVQKTLGRLTGWLGYGIGFVYAKFDSLNQGKWFHPKYDRTHDFKVVVQYKLTENIEVGGTWTLQSGQSYTGATSRSQLFLPNQSIGSAKVAMSDLYALRLPASHQLNIYGAYNFKLFGKDARYVIDIYNVYNRRDILMRYYNTREETTKAEDMRLLPIIPSMSFEVKF